MNVRHVLILAALSEAATGLIALVYPPIVIRLLFDSEIEGAGVLVSRLAGIALIGLAVACWPDPNAYRAWLGMLSYSVLATLYLAYVAVATRSVGTLLWPAVAVHVALALLLALAWRKERPAPEAGT